ncbi:hypothetical protein Y032_0132g1714 [Ancylostoma ceylanicum]|uniref:Uncharacterized protein n=1 Tax=Ancylostoma ceylanicum TaxID=53326 RepID=A0A016T6T6_9BILA|nr:hypothetical protein Y032_0132g1714 [Ancylostoma ceylanicum]
MRIALLLLGVGLAFANYNTEPSGYGSNNQYEVQHVAGKSPHNKPIDYTRSSDFPGFNVIGNKFKQQTLGQFNIQGQQNFQKGGDQTNIGLNQNEVNVGQTNNQNVGGRRGYDAPYRPGYPSGYNPATNVIGNNFDLQTLGQVNTQGQASVQQGGAQTNVGSNANAVNVGQQNNQGGAGVGYGAGYKPSYDAPSYGGGPIYIPDFNNFIRNNVYSQNLGQANTQGQQNVQKGGDQTNVGVNTNAVNVGQQNNQGGQGGNYGKPSYDAPTYAAILIPHYNVIGNKIDAQTLGQANNQGQTNVQKGGDQTNVGSNVNAVSVGQANSQGTSRTRASYDARKRVTSPRVIIRAPVREPPEVRKSAPVRRPAPIRKPAPVRKPTPAKRPTPVQPSVQPQGTASIPTGQSPSPAQGTTQGQGDTSPQQSPTQGGAPGQVAGNKASQQNLGQGSTQGQTNIQKGGDQANVGINTNVINISQTNNQSVNGIKQSDSVPQSDTGSGYRRRS